MKLYALITGASRGIGREIAYSFAKQGYHLVLNCLSNATLIQDLKMELEEKYGITCIVSVGDVSEEAYVSQLFAEIQASFGHLDVLVNNAGISYVGLLQDMSLDNWNRIQKTNVTSMFLCCKYAISLMLPRKNGSITNISSVWGTCGASCEVAYSASKGAVNTFTKALAKELGPSNIRVNAVACGIIDTSMNAFLSEEEKANIVDEIPLGRIGTVNEVAQCVLDLSISSTYMTGQVITLDGGWCS